VRSVMLTRSKSLIVAPRVDSMRTIHLYSPQKAATLRSRTPSQR
jgi:hypothetical protein